MQPKELKNKVIELRQLGFSHGEISKKLNISKSTSSLWAKGIAIPKESENLLTNKTKNTWKKGLESKNLNLFLKYDLIQKNS